MIPQDIENSIIKYLNQAADINDLNVLNDWLEHQENQLHFQSYVETHFAITLAMNKPDLDKIQTELLKEIRNDKKLVFNLKAREFIKYAAIAVVFLGLGVLLKKNLFADNNQKVVIPRENSITLQLGNGETIIMSENSNSDIINGSGGVVGTQKGEQIVYPVGESISESNLNTLTIPKGKRFSIVLSDGTKVHLNAESSITYPSSFNRDKKRRVTLVGEAYFEVSHDALSQFVVNSQELDIRVYGTKFNISNYPEDEAYEVVLVDGLVSMAEVDKADKLNQEMYLKPGFKGTLNKHDKKLKTQKVNTALYTSWMHGNLVFRDEKFKNIIQELERYYNVVIINNDDDIANEIFNATIETEHETIEQVFNYFEKIYDIDYTIVENKIIINQK